MLKFTEFVGTPFQIGFSLGQYGAEAVHTHLIHSLAWRDLMQWRGSPQVQAMQDLVQKHQPYIWDEIQGLAKGLALPGEEVFIWNCRDDLIIDKAIDSSTTLLQIDPSGPRISHNVDVSPIFDNYCAVAEFSPQQGMAFASFIYPGSIPGHTFAVNEQGIALTANSIQLNDLAAGLPRWVITRALLNATSLSNALAIINQSPRAGGFHLSLAQQGLNTLLSIEFQGKHVSIEPVSSASLHANHFIHEKMSRQDQRITESSYQRQRIGNQLIKKTENIHNPLTILADQSDPLHPIYQNNPDSGCITLASADIRIGSERVEWDVYTHPDKAAHFKMINAKHL